MGPLPATKASILGAQLGLGPKAAVRRLLRTADKAAVSLAPEALTAFAPGSMCITTAGVTVDKVMWNASSGSL